MSSRFVRGPLVYSNTTVKTTSGDVTCVNESQVIVLKDSGAATAVTLPTNSTLLTGQTIIVKDGKGDAATNNITVAAATGNIDGAANYVISQNYGSATFTWNGTEWGVIALGSSGSSGVVLANAITGTDSSLGITGKAGTGTGGAGGAIVSTGGAGTAHTSGTGGAGGAVSLVGGAAGTATTGTAGAGGAASVTGTVGGAASAAAGIGGAGGATAVTAGAGGASSHASGGVGGAGGAASLTGGAGGATSGTSGATGGAGGTVTITAGAGGAAGGGTSNGGAAGSVVLVAGTGGTSAGGTAGIDGVVVARGLTFARKISAPAAKTTTTTLTAAELLGGLLTANQGAAGTATYTTCTGTDLQNALPSSFTTGDSFDFTIVNISTNAAEIVTVQGDTGMTAVGNMTIAANNATTTQSWGTFRVRKTGNNAFSFYRIG